MAEYCEKYDVTKEGYSCSERNALGGIPLRANTGPIRLRSKMLSPLTDADDHSGGSCAPTRGLSASKLISTHPPMEGGAAPEVSSISCGSLL